MFGKKCTLCGGKLDGRGICTECGLDNNKSEKNYKINQSSCDGKPLTHVHSEDTRAQGSDKYKYREGKPAEHRESYHAAQEKLSRREKAKADKKSAITKWLTIATVVLTAVGILVGILENYSTEIIDQGETNVTEEDMNSIGDYAYDPYKYVDNELPEGGETLEFTLGSGIYIVGFHFPEGKYTAQTGSEFDVVQVTDKVNGVYLYEYEDKEDNYLNDLRMYRGAAVTVKCEDTVTFKTENGQTAVMEEGQANTLTEQVEIAKEGRAVAGEDFEAGIYDVVSDGQYSFVTVFIYDEKGEEIRSLNLNLGEDETDGEMFSYLVLPQGAAVECAGSAGIVLTPSEKIVSTDYLEFYNSIY